MATVDLLLQETVEVFLRHGVCRVAAHRFGDFAVHRSTTGDLFSRDWRITHLPTGRCVAGDFRTMESAADAMVGMSEQMVNRYCRFSAQRENALAAVHYLDKKPAAMMNRKARQEGQQ